MDNLIRVGVTYNNGTAVFTLWAPIHKKMQIKVSDGKKAAVYDMVKDGEYFTLTLNNVKPQTSYAYIINGKELGDPASRFQPRGVHGPSQIADLSFKWHPYKAPLMKDLIIYEMHVGAFTKEGTFASAIKKLPEVKAAGINAVEILPVAQCAGERNWGYDGVYPFATAAQYGGYKGLMEFVNAAHKLGLAVILDVVYNHLGPEGNYVDNFAPYYTGKYTNPWGKALNFDSCYCDGVHNYFLENARFWLEDMHIDGLRLDAIDMISDLGTRHIMAQLSAVKTMVEKRVKSNKWLIAESDLNNTKILDPYSKNGYNLDGQWTNDFHHSLQALFTGDTFGYYKDYNCVEDIALAIDNTFRYNWKYSKFRGRHHGSDAKNVPGSKFVVYTQNHDQVGNRKTSDRLTTIIGLKGAKTASMLMMLTPYVPMLFMGEEYGETAPFMFFCDFKDEHLINAVKKGRAREYELADYKLLPDPFHIDTLNKSKLNHNLKNTKEHKEVFNYYKKLIKLRKTVPYFAELNKKTTKTFFDEESRVLIMTRASKKALVIVNLSDKPATLSFNSPQFKQARLNKEYNLLLANGSFPKKLTQTLNLKPYDGAVYAVA